MDKLTFWLGLLLATYLLVAMCLVMLGQSIRPFGLLLKATTFWVIFSLAGALFIYFVLVPLL